MPAAKVFAKSPDGFISVDDIKLRIRVCGRGTPLLLISGLGGCIEGWQTLADELPGRLFVAVDHPGTGGSQVPDRLLTIPDLAKLYVRVMDQLEIDTFDVMGYSFGGTLAQQLAKMYPDRVRSIILAATACGWGGLPADPFTLMVASNPMRYQFETARKLSSPLIYRGRVGRHPSLFADELSGWSAHRSSLMGVFYQVMAYSMWTSLPWLRTLHVPALVLGGKQDPMAPVLNSKLLAAMIPDAELHVVKDGGHLFPFDQADEVGPVITKFLNRIGSAVAA